MTPVARLRRRLLLTLAGGPVVLVLSALAASLFGPFGPFDARTDRDPFTVGQVVIGWVGAGSATWMLYELRLPRIALAGLTGMALAMSGAAMQAVFRNPLAEPFILGVSTGAALGASLHIVLALGASTAWLGIPALAFAGGLAATLVTYGIGGAGRGGRGDQLLLAGVALSSLLTAILLAFMFFAGEQFRSLFFWILGGFELARWTDSAILGTVVLGGIATLVARSRAMNLLMLGDDQASSLGLDVRREKTTLLVVASLLASVSVAFAGAIGFVGLMVPHVVRLVVGSDHRVLVPASAFLGGAFLILADLAARSVLDVGTLPIGVITAFAGAPFFLWLLYRRRRQGLARFS